MVVDVIVADFLLGPFCKSHDIEVHGYSCMRNNKSSKYGYRYMPGELVLYA